MRTTGKSISVAAYGVVAWFAMTLVAAGPLLIVPSWTGESDQPFANFGWSVAGAGDVNNDGHDDVIVGAVFFDNGQQDEGRAFLYLGSAAGLSLNPVWAPEGNQFFANFGYSVASAGDVNNDGFADVIVGAPLDFAGEVREGRTFVYHGRLGGPSTVAAWTSEGNQAEANFGWSVASAGDFNNDGFSDVVVGAPLFANGQTEEGRVYIYLGGGGGLAIAPAWTLEDNQAGANFGWIVASAGDVNNDGFSDVVVGAPRFTNGQTEEGRAYVYLGGAGFFLRASWMAEGDQAGANFGWSVASAGDVNNDGFSDVVVGAPRFTNGETREGRAYVYLGGSDGLASTPAWTVEGNQDFANLGYSVAAAGDVNKDGFADVIVGAYQYDGGETDEGRALVYLGGSGGLNTAPVWTAESDQNLAWFGHSVAGAGDVDADGHSDIIIGVPHANHPESKEGRALVYHGLEVISTGVPTLPVRFALHQNFPNPFNPTTQIRFGVGRDGPVTLDVYDVSGRRVRKLVGSIMSAGNYTAAWDGLDEQGLHAASGIYFFRLTSGNRTLVRKAVLLK